ncbi:SGNH/GDSL hydrolase family protein [Peterkaempfera bronchialis]|uniref:SGNH/GDSL hydrolase family protein n=1 Tax=Peterkaempfera bronchialis TaxID=2126346 RepID=A0A345SU13_9ACTN|nr:SGNH/GDSL hydrolase family protein [Peterkaempfera bronchialis]AXI77218.1 SGNH/GDSL hydrolase family protein [Peterkaempfera bronchialis]
MRAKSSLVSLISVAALAAAITVTTPAAGAGHTPDTHAPGPIGAAGPREPNAHWVGTWAAMPQLTEPSNMPPAPFTQDSAVMVDTTLRQTVHVSVGGNHIRLRISNAFGGAVLPVTAVSVALPAGGAPGTGAIQAGTAHRLTFQGRSSVSVPAGAQALSDPLDFPLQPDSNLTVTIYLASGQASTSITSHPGSRTTSYMLAGDHLSDTSLAGATTADHWYFVSGVEVWSKAKTSAAVVLGDSLTDGRGSTTNGNDRWPDQLLKRLKAGPQTAATALLNQAAGGNRLLNDGLGPNGLARLDRDVLAQSGVDWLLVFEGVNDIGTAEATQAAQRQVAADLIAAYEQIIARAHAQGIRVYGATITPFGGNDYDDPSGYRELARQTVNTWMRTSGRFDSLIDFDRAARDPQNPRQLRPTLDVGDHLHFNPVGYQALAEAVPTTLFQQRPLPPGFGYAG